MALPQTRESVQMADETKSQQQGGQTNYGSQQGQQGQNQQGQSQQSGQSGQKNLDPNKKGSTTGQKEDEDDQNRDRQRRAS
jgi:hypothetical protein